MIKRILLLFVVLAAMLTPATAATKVQSHKKHSAVHSKKSKSKSMRKSAHHRNKSASSRKRQKLAKR